MGIVTSVYRFACLIFLFLVSCRSQCRQWELATIQSDCPSLTYAKVFLPTCNNFKGLSAELVSNAEGVVFYLNALTFQFQKSSDPGFSTVDIEIDGQWYSSQAIRLEGGQKIILPQELQELIVTALVADQPVEVRVGRYHELLIADNFTKTYGRIVCSFTGHIE